MSESDVELLRRMEEICDEFENQWSADGRLDIKSFADKFEAPYRNRLIQMLIEIDIEQCNQAGQPASRQDYAHLDQQTVTRMSSHQDLQSTDESRDFDPDDPTTDGGKRSTGDENVVNRTGVEIADSTGRFQLVKKLGEGGMGTVWKAEQVEPVRRTVAIKVIKSGVASKEVMARFDAEKQALARMNHPNIARILSAGTTVSDEPYFAMELVEGKPLTRFCDRHQLGIDERLKLFNDVCSAVQHAHQKGIIHRDLKPSNILVAEIDGAPVAKVIDFGLAKALDSIPRLTDQTLATEVGQILGTLKYMSPEQASLDDVDIDTRTDVYALGVILYELLTGDTPLDSREIKNRAVLKILESIRDEEPVKPSSRISSMSLRREESKVAEVRRTNSGSLRRLLAGDLDWIVMKALEKDRQRRYESASEFAQDVCRFLDSEPVLARPPSATYRVSKFVRKNRSFVMAAGLVVLALIGGIVGTSFGMLRAMSAEDKANTRFNEAESARKKEKAAQIQSQERLQQIQKSNSILVDIFQGLDVRRAELKGEPVQSVLAQKLVEAADQLDDGVVDAPVELADMKNSLAISISHLGNGKQAIEIFKSALAIQQSKLGLNHVDTLNTSLNLANSYKYIRDFDKAIEAYKHIETLLISDSPELETIELRTRAELGDAYVQNGEFEMALEVLEPVATEIAEKLGDDDPITLQTLCSLGIACQHNGQPDRAFDIFDSLVKSSRISNGEIHPDTLTAMNNLAGILRSEGKNEQALKMYQNVLDERISLFGMNHPETLVSQNNLGFALYKSGDTEQAEKLLKQSYEGRIRVVGADNPDTILTERNLAVVYLVNNRRKEALVLWERMLTRDEQALGTNNEKVRRWRLLCAKMNARVGNLPRAIELFEEDLGYRVANQEENDPQTVDIYREIGNASMKSQDYEKAVENFAKFVAAKENLGQARDLKTIFAFASIAFSHGQLGNWEQAVSMHNKTVELSSNVNGPKHESTVLYKIGLATTYRDMKEYDKAIKLLFEIENSTQEFGLRKNSQTLLRQIFLANNDRPRYLETAKRQLNESRKEFDNEAPEFPVLLFEISVDLAQLEEYSEAETLLRESVAIGNKISPNELTTFFAKAVLGFALLGKKDYEESETYLLDGLAGIQQRSEALNNNNREYLKKMVQKIIQLYSESGRPEKAEQWQKRLDSLPPITNEKVSDEPS